MENGATQQRIIVLGRFIQDVAHEQQSGVAEVGAQQFLHDFPGRLAERFLVDGPAERVDAREQRLDGKDCVTQSGVENVQALQHRLGVLQRPAHDARMTEKKKQKRNRSRARALNAKGSYLMNPARILESK